MEEHRKVLSLRPVKHIFEENVLLMEKKHISVVYVISFTIRRKSDVEVHCKITLREDKFLSLYLNSKVKYRSFLCNNFARQRETKS